MVITNEERERKREDASTNRPKPKRNDSAPARQRPDNNSGRNPGRSDRPKPHDHGVPR
jgi:hypothetical protein